MSSVEPQRVRRAQIRRYLLGTEGRTIKQVANYLGLDYLTARRYLAEMYNDGMIDVRDVHTNPKQYFIPIGLDDE
jgi:predicted ArsR family transcriptional regulator